MGGGMEVKKERGKDEKRKSRFLHRGSVAPSEIGESSRDDDGGTSKSSMPVAQNFHFVTIRPQYVTSVEHAISHAPGASILQKNHEVYKILLDKYERENKGTRAKLLVKFWRNKCARAGLFWSSGYYGDMLGPERKINPAAFADDRMTKKIVFSFEKEFDNDRAIWGETGYRSKVVPSKVNSTKEAEWKLMQHNAEDDEKSELVAHYLNYGEGNDNDDGDAYFAGASNVNINKDKRKSRAYSDSESINGSAAVDDDDDDDVNDDDGQSSGFASWFNFLNFGGNKKEAQRRKSISAAEKERRKSISAAEKERRKSISAAEKERRKSISAAEKERIKSGASIATNMSQQSESEQPQQRKHSEEEERKRRGESHGKAKSSLEEENKLKMGNQAPKKSLKFVLSDEDIRSRRNKLGEKDIGKTGKLGYKGYSDKYGGGGGRFDFEEKEDAERKRKKSASKNKLTFNPVDVEPAEEDFLNYQKHRKTPSREGQSGKATSGENIDLAWQKPSATSTEESDLPNISRARNRKKSKLSTGEKEKQRKSLASDNHEQKGRRKTVVVQNPNISMRKKSFNAAVTPKMSDMHADEEAVKLFKDPKYSNHSLHIAELPAQVTEIDIQNIFPEGKVIFTITAHGSAAVVHFDRPEQAKKAYLEAKNILLYGHPLEVAPKLREDN